MRLYVVIGGGSKVPRVYSSISAMSSALGIGYHRLWRVFGYKGEDKYSEYGLDIWRVDLVRSFRKKSTASQ